MHQDDLLGTAAATEVFQWHARNEDIFGNTINPSRVLILAKPESAPRGRDLIFQQSLRGIYRILAENHIPAVVSETTEALKDPGSFDLVIVTPGAAVNGLEEFIEKGGRALYVGEEPGFAIPSRVKQHDLARVAYAELRDAEKLPSLKGVKYLMATSICPYTVIDIFSKKEVETMPFIEYPEEPGAMLSFIPR
jgi:hypothetical protein